MIYRSLGDYTIAAIPDIPPGKCSCWVLKKGCRTARHCFTASSESDVFQFLDDIEIFDACLTRYESYDGGVDSINLLDRQIIIRC